MSPQQQLGPYRLIARIGKGGMGEVWKAHDTRLGRDVAVKLSAERFSDRFEKEARAIAALNHPNICTLFDVGPNYLVMELIDGPTLADRIADGPIPLDEAIAIGKQITDALDAAHEKHIVHRDLKPGNIKVRPDGSVKVLDFGLAKSGTPDTQMNDDSPTMAMATQMGVILGTAAYMAPEQARGKPVDKRADIWAFGVVVYEMVTGRQLFAGEDLTETLANVVKSDPDFTAAPQRLKRLLTKCLQKDPKKRLRDIGDAWDYLDDTAAFFAAPSQSRPGTGMAIAAGIFAIAFAALAFLHFREKPAETPVSRTYIEPPEGGRLSNNPEIVSPDGKRIVFSALANGKAQLWLRSLDSLTAQPLPNTEGAGHPCWSPDGKSIAFFAVGKLRKMEIPSGPATVLADASTPRGCAWSADGVIVFAPVSNGGLQQVSSAGGTARPATRLDSKMPAQRYPSFLPDGKHFLYLSGGISQQQTIRVGSVASPADDRVLLDGVQGAARFAQGYLLYVRGNALIARPFDPNKLAFTGEETPVIEQVRPTGATGLWEFSVSDDGVLVYRAGRPNARLTWLDRTGRRLETIGEPGFLTKLQLSPDRKTAAVRIQPSPGTGDIWLYDLARGVSSRLTFGPATAHDSAWSPDGHTLLFRSVSTDGHDSIGRKRADGASNEETLYADGLQKYPGNVSPDGRFLVYTTQGDPKTGYDIWILPDPLGTPGGSKPYPFLRGQANEGGAHFSPDGKWISYVSDESGRSEVYVTPFPGPGAKRQVSTAGVATFPAPLWRQDGKELYYVALDGRVMAAQVDEKEGIFNVQKVVPLFGPIDGMTDLNVSADGQRFLTLLPPEGDRGEPVTVVQNWLAGLKR